jgi:hypothetical protein
MRARLLAPLVALGLLAAGCASDAEMPAKLQSNTGHAAHATQTVAPVKAKPAPVDVPARPGESFQTVSMAAAYTPKAPTANGTDDYRCFLIDPKFTQDMLVSGIKINPGNAKLVHHVIIYKIEADEVAKAKARDAEEPGDGWTCFSGTGLEKGPGGNLNKSDWVAAWAPGGGENVMANDIAIPLAKGTQLALQIHYNLLAGNGSDLSSARLRISPAKGSTKAPLETMLMPAPVELPCREGKSGGMCYRSMAVADIRKRFNEDPATADLLHLLCGDSKPGPTQHCDRKIKKAGTIRAVAGHMHLLGRSITVDINKGTPQARRILDIPVWDFDDQGAKPLPKPAKVVPGDTLTVTCTHDQSLRDRLPAFKGQPERYVAWGEGTTDEMCLGIVLMTRP